MYYFQDRNEKNLSLSRMSTEKRTLQRQIDHMRENSRNAASKNAALKDEIETLTSQCKEYTIFIEDHEKLSSQKVKEVQDRFDQSMKEKQVAFDDLVASKRNLETLLQEAIQKQTQLANSVKQKLNEEEYKEQVKKLKQELQCCNKGMSDSETSNKAIIDKYEEITARYDVLSETNKQLLVENETFQKEVARLMTEKENYEKQMISRVNTLEIGKNELQSSKDSVERLLREKENSEKQLKEICENLQKAAEEENNELFNLRKTSINNEERVSNTQRKCDALKKENERLLLKCRQIEKSSGEVVGLMAELSRLKDANGMLLQRYRVLETSENSRDEFSKSKEDEFSKSKESEREKYSALLMKFDHLCTQHRTITADHEVKLKEHGQLVERYEILEKEKLQLDAVSKNLTAENVVSCDSRKLLEKENQDLNEKLIAEKAAQIQLTKNWEIEKNEMENKFKLLSNELNELKTRKLKGEQDYQYILKSHKEEAHTQLTMKQKQIEQETHAIKTKYDLLRVDFEKLNKEKEHYVVTIETQRAENTKLHEEINKQRLNLSSTQDLVIQRLQGNFLIT